MNGEIIPFRLTPTALAARVFVVNLIRAGHARRLLNRTTKPETIITAS